MIQIVLGRSVGEWKWVWGEMWWGILIFMRSGIYMPSKSVRENKTLTNNNCYSVLTTLDGTLTHFNHYERKLFWKISSVLRLPKSDLTVPIIMFTNFGNNFQTFTFHHLSLSSYAWCLTLVDANCCWWLGSWLSCRRCFKFLILIKIQYILYIDKSNDVFSSILKYLKV